MLNELTLNHMWHTSNIETCRVFFLAVIFTQDIEERVLSLFPLYGADDKLGVNGQFNLQEENVIKKRRGIRM